MKIIDHPSPNFDQRGGAVDMLVLHYTAMPTAQSALEKLCDATPGSRVSAHYLVDEEGKIFCLVPEDKRAWHAGVSYWRGHTDINARSIGIEIANPGDQPFPPAQMQAVAALCKDIIARHSIPSWNVVGHSDVAPGRKADPGEHFNWQWLAEQGIGLWPSREAASKGLFADPLGWVKRVLRVFIPYADSHAAGKDLSRFGYGMEGADNEKAKQVVTAFQRHFRPARVDGVWDDECRLLLNDLLARAPSATLHSPDGRMAAPPLNSCQWVNLSM